MYRVGVTLRVSEIIRLHFKLVFLAIFSIALTACGGSSSSDPGISSFSAAKTTITLGDSITITPVFSGGTATVDNGVGTVTSGTPVTVSPTTTTTYTLTFTDSGTGDVTTRQVTITVVPAPTISSFTAAATTITEGNSTTLTGVFADGSGSIDQGVGAVNTNVAVNTGVLNATTTFTLTVTNAAGTAATRQVTVTVVPLGTISLSPAISTISIGSSTTLTVNFDNSNGETATLTGFGTVNPGDTKIVAPTVTTTYTLTVTNAASDTITADAIVNVVPLPTITSFTAAAGTITAGGSTTLTGLFANGTGSVDQGIGNVSNNVAVDTGILNTTTTFTLTVTNAAGSTTTRQVTVTVVPAPTANLVSSDADNNITSGDNITLTPTFTNAATAVISNDQDATTIDAAALGSGNPTASLNPTTTTTYTLTVTNAAGATATSAVTVNVFQTPTAGLSSSDADNNITSGDSITLTPTFANGTGVITNDQDASTINVTSGVATASLSPTTTTTYTLTVTNGAGITATDTVTVNVFQTPTAGLSSSDADNNITSGDSITLTPTFTNGTGVITNDQDASTINVTSGVATASLNPTTTTTYTLTVTNGAGVEATSSVTVNVFQTPTASMVSSDADNNITSGDSFTLTPTFTNAATAVISNDQDATTIDAAALGSGNPTASLSPTTTTTYTLTVTNGAGVEATSAVTVNVFQTPTAGLSSSDADNNITLGDSFTLMPTFANGTGVITNDQDASTINVTSGVATASLSPTTTTTYTLTVTNGAGVEATTTVTVTVLAAPTASMVSSDADNNITSGDSITLTPTFANGTGVITNDQDASTINVTSGVATASLSPTTTTTYTLTVTNGAGAEATSAVTVNVFQTPTASMVSSDADDKITAGDTYTLTPTFTNGTGVITNNQDASTINVTSGVATADLGPTTTTTYTLTVTNGAGITATDTVTVTVLGAPTAGLTSSDADNNITSGDSFTLTPTFTNAVTAVISNDQDATTIDAVALGSGNPTTSLSPTTDTTYTLTVTNGDGATATSSVTVNVFQTPTAGLTSSNTNIVAGDPITLTPTFTNAATAVISNDQDATTIDAVALGSGNPTASLSPTTTRTYTLTVTNGAGVTATSSVTVTVLPAVLNVSYGFRQLIFSWTDVSGATYNLLENPDGASGFTPIASNLAAGTTSYTHNISVHLRGNAQYMLEVCNPACGNSNTVDVSGAVFAAIGYFKGLDTNSSDQFGHGVALSSDGTTMAVGARTAGTEEGAVYVFINTAGVWSQQAKIQPDAVVAYSDFGARVALSNDGNTLAVGVYGDDTSATGVATTTPSHDCDTATPTSCALDSGAAYVFTRSGTTWSQEAYIKPSTTTEGDGFGWALALSHDGNTLAVSSPFEDSAATDVGGTEAHHCWAGATYNSPNISPDSTTIGTGGSVDLTVTFDNVPVADTGGVITNDQDATSIPVINGQTVNVSPTAATTTYTLTVTRADATTYTAQSVVTVDPVAESNCATNSGAAYVFTRSGTAWSQQAYVKSANTTAAGDGNFGFGIHLALNGNDGNTLAVGAPHEAVFAGRAYIYTRSVATWSTGTTIDTASLSGFPLNFGSAISLSDDGGTLAVGAEGESTGGLSAAGAAYIFTAASGWSEQAFLKASNAGANDWFGYSLALSGDGTHLVVGADQESSAAKGINGDETDDSAISAGAVYLFTSASGWSQQAYIKAPNASAGYWFGRNLAISDDGSVLAVGSRFEDTAAQGIYKGDDSELVSDCGTTYLNCQVDAGAVYLY